MDILLKLCVNNQRLWFEHPTCSNGGEKKLTIDDKTYKVDGFCEKTNTVYEFYGCFWHGCPNCYKPNIIKSKNQRDMGTLNDLTIEK